MFFELKPTYDSDLVISAEDKTYLCYLNPEVSEDKQRETDIRKQKCWRIVLIQQVETDSTTEVRRMYPNGDAYNYAYAPDSIADYTFEYRR